MKKKWKAQEGYLYIPVQTETAPAALTICADGQTEKQISVSLAKDRVDYWEAIWTEAKRELCVETPEEDRWLRAVQLLPKRPPEEEGRSLYHCFLTKGSAGKLLSLSQKADGFELRFTCDPWRTGSAQDEKTSSCEVGTAGGRDLLSLETDSWTLAEKQMKISKDCADFEQKFTRGQAADAAQLLTGDLADRAVFLAGDGRIVLGISRRIENAKCCGHVLTLPAFAGEDGALHPLMEAERLRVWTRQWKHEAVCEADDKLAGEPVDTPADEVIDESADEPWRESLRFRIAPSVWPNIRILEAEGKADDITAEAFELCLSLTECTAEWVELELDGLKAVWNRRTGKLEAEPYQIEAKLNRSETEPYRIDAGQGSSLTLRMFSDRFCGEIFCGGQMLFLLKRDPKRAQSVDNSISGNLDGCVLEEKRKPEIVIRPCGGGRCSAQVTVYGLRSPWYDGRIKEKLPQGEADVFFADKHYTIWSNRVRDERYGAPDAWAWDGKTVVSPVRIPEEFVWRDTPWGDMVRAADRGELWRCRADMEYYPEIKSGIPVVDAAYHIAVEILDRCKGPECAQEGQQGMWSAGLFQGEGGGFGVWLRDSAHTALRCGSLIDRDGASGTLRYTAVQGFDNGSDGPAMAILGIWDYCLVSGDETIIFETWPMLLRHIREIDARYCEEKGLVRAEQSTSNDAFPEPENGGFCLGTECYFMKAYADMAQMGEIAGHNPQDIAQWQRRAETMREAIRTLYWNEERGFYTSGPIGSEAYERGFWETSGEEGVLWNKFNIADAKQKKRILDYMEHSVMTEYGVPLFPYRKERNHFCGPVWVVWEAGIASAAGECGKSDLLLKLIAQQIRSCVMNKTFYEVVDAENGKAWRWPGQLWHAAGFLSFFFYGILGIRYEKEGLYFSPCVPEKLKNLHFSHLHYRQAYLDVEVKGCGTDGKLLVDGRTAPYFPAEETGKHKITLVMREEKNYDQTICERESA